MERSDLIKKIYLNNDVSDRESLEAILCNYNPGRGYCDEARKLIEMKTSIEEVFKSDPEELMSVGLSKAEAYYLMLVGQLCTIDKPSDVAADTFSREKFKHSLTQKYKPLRYETLDIFAMDSSGKMRSMISFTNKSIFKVNADPKKILSFLLKADATFAVAAHNHPFATSAPSPEDDVFTKNLFIVCLYNGIFLSDHFIVGEDDVYSYYESGKIYAYFKCAKEEVEASLKR